jgi:hypothetical protein
MNIKHKRIKPIFGKVLHGLLIAVAICAFLLLAALMWDDCSYTTYTTEAWSGNVTSPWSVGL